MYEIDSSNAKEHSYPVYGRQFKSYKWYKPILTAIVFFVIDIVLSVALTLGVVYIVSGKTAPDSLAAVLSNIFASGYDDMDLANLWQSVMSLGSVALMIPSLWLASVIVRDRPFSSYSSARGGWSGKVFWRTMLVAFICISLPIIVDEVFVQHHINDFNMRFTLASFAVVTILGPLQCIAEEYVFRGLLMQTFGSWFRLPIIAVILQSVVFMCMHPYNTLGKIEIVVSGVVFALAAWIGRGIEASSAFHICNNMAIFYLEGLNLTTISSETDMRSVIMASVCGAVYVIVLFIMSKKTNLFDKVKKEDAVIWNEKIEDKQARKAAKAAKRIARKEGSSGKHDIK